MTFLPARVAGKAQSGVSLPATMLSSIENSRLDFVAVIMFAPLPVMVEAFIARRFEKLSAPPPCVLAAFPRRAIGVPTVSSMYDALGKCVCRTYLTYIFIGRL